MRAWIVGIALGLMGASAAAAPPLKPVAADIAYGPDAKQTFDVYAPPRAHRAPILVMVHGGGWRIGDKSSRGVVGAKGEYWVGKGYVFVSANYRLLPDTGVAAQADDVAAALAYVQAHAGEWGGDPTRVVMMGHSAGAHLVALISADPARAAARGAKPWAGSVILDSAVVDVEAVMTRRHLPLYDDAFGTDRADWRTLSPIAQLHGTVPPMLLVCSTTRKDQPCNEANAFAQKARGMGRRAEVSGQALTHREINVTLGEPGAYTQTVDTFVAGLVR